MGCFADLIGLLLLLAGGVFGLKSKRRRFDRTNRFGVERFPDFLHKVVNKTVDRVLNGGAILLLTSGSLLLAYDHVTSWGWILWLPVGLFVLYVFIGT